MSALSLTKNYADGTLFFVADVHDMWTELETKTNGNIDDDNVAADWASWNMVTLSKDVSFTMGTTASGILRFYTSTNEFVFAHATTIKEFIFKVAGTAVMTLDTSANLSVTKDIYFYNSNTTYPLSYLIGYAKPVLVYSDGTTINVEQNLAIANKTLIVFPSGPIAVTEDIASTHKFRQLKTSATANGYLASHTGAADSGMKVGLSLTANTYYFVYAVVVQGGDDAGNNFVLVVDSTNPAPSNWSTLDTAYTAGKWVYLGLFRYGHGGAKTTTMIPFLQDHQGWHSFTGNAATDNSFGIRVDSQTISSSTYTTLETFTAANSGDAAPATCSTMLVAIKPLVDADADIVGNIIVSDGSDVVLWNLQSFGETVDYHGFLVKLPNQGLKLKIKRGAASGDDFSVTTFISAVLDEWV